MKKARINPDDSKSENRYAAFRELRAEAPVHETGGGQRFAVSQKAVEDGLASVESFVGSFGNTGLRWRRLVILAGLCASLLGGDVSPTRSITLRWQQDGDVAGFRVYQHTYLKPWGDGLDVGLPNKVDGVYAFEMEVSNLEATWIAMTSYDRRGLESPKSEAKVYLLPEE